MNLFIKDSYNGHLDHYAAVNSAEGSRNVAVEEAAKCVAGFE